MGYELWTSGSEENPFTLLNSDGYWYLVYLAKYSPTGILCAQLIPIPYTISHRSIFLDSRSHQRVVQRHLRSDTSQRDTDVSRLPSFYREYIFSQLFYMQPHAAFFLSVFCQRSSTTDLNRLEFLTVIFCRRLNQKTIFLKRKKRSIYKFEKSFTL